MPQVIKSTDYYPQLLFHVGMNDTASQNLGSIKKDYKALGVQVKSLSSSYQLEKTGQPEIDKKLLSISCYMTGAVTWVWIFLTMGHSLMILTF